MKCVLKPHFFDAWVLKGHDIEIVDCDLPSWVMSLGMDGRLRRNIGGIWTLDYGEDRQYGSDGDYLLRDEFNRVSLCPASKFRSLFDVVSEEGVCY